MSLKESPQEMVERLLAERSQEVLFSPSVKVVVSGGRDYSPTRAELDLLLDLLDHLEAVELHHGDCNRELSGRLGRPVGVDQIVAKEVAAKRPHIKIIPHPAEWKLYGKQAGPIRNQEMLVVGSVLVRFRGGKGTTNCTNQAKRMGRKTYSIILPA